MTLGDRGERTRERLLDAALALFSERGFDGVSTRELAIAAGTTLASIADHFGSREGLYRSVIASAADEMARMALPASQAVEALLAQDAPAREQALETLLRLVQAHARAMLGMRHEWPGLIVREELRSPNALAPVDALYERHLLQPVARLVGILRGLPPDAVAVKLQAAGLLGRVMVHRYARASTLRFLGWPELVQAGIEIIVAELGKEVRALFAHEAAAAEPGPLQ